MTLSYPSAWDMVEAGLAAVREVYRDAGSGDALTAPAVGGEGEDQDR
jgi:hypothetical protein